MKALLIAVALAACHRLESAPVIERVRADDLVAKFECTRCHEVPNAESAVRDKHCFGCHQQIHAGTFAAKPETLVKWRAHIQSMRSAPSLMAASRLTRSAVREMLLNPHDVRPGSIAMMPRLVIGEREAARLAEFLVPDEDSPIAFRQELVERGAALFEQLACGRCHRFTGARLDDPGLHERAKITDEQRRSPGVEAQAVAWTLAPDLRFARERMQPARVAAWIEHPGGAMPVIPGVGPDEAQALAAYVMTAPLSPRRPPEISKRLPVLEREVAWAEVSEKVFHDTCWHCHAVPDFARGDGGPGNSGGFGFKPRGLDLSSYVGISEGSFDDAGERRSVFEKRPDGTPRIVAHLMARHVEAAGGTGDVRGMPLGLPPLSLEQIQLVESWIAQGRPQ